MAAFGRAATAAPGGVGAAALMRVARGARLGCREKVDTLVQGRAHDGRDGPFASLPFGSDPVTPAHIPRA